MAVATGYNPPYTMLVDVSDGQDKLVLESKAQFANSSNVATEVLPRECSFTEAEVVRLRDDIAELREVEAERLQRLEEVNKLWSRRVREIQREIDEHRKIISTKEMQLHLLTEPPPEVGDDVPEPPGPQWLRFVEGNYFMLVASLVIIANIVTMFMEMIDKKYVQEFFWVDQFFMIFYIAELLFKAILWRRLFLIGKLSVVWWNWLDLIIVVSGVMDMYLKKLLIICGLIPHDSGRGPSLLSFLRMLRLARLARILKIVRIFLVSDVSWAEGDRFQKFIMSVIGINSVIMGAEADIPEFWGWFYVEQALLIIFSFELLLRLKLHGRNFFCNEGLVWNWLDFIIVAGGVIDQWMMPAIDLVKQLMGLPTSDASSMKQVMVILRMARLLRILRLVRLVKNIPPLFNLVTGIIQAMQGMGWVLLLTAVILYTFALLGVRLVGHGLIFGGEIPEQAAAIFPNIFQSMFVFFKVMNADLSPLEPLFQVMPISKVFATIFMVLSSWAILSILTAVVSENMINACDSSREETAETEAKEQEIRSRVKLNELFGTLDTDRSGDINLDEFEAMLRNEDSVFELCDATGMSKRDLRELFNYLSSVPTGHIMPVIPYKDFIEGLCNESRPVSERSMMRLEKRLCILEELLKTDKKVGEHNNPKDHGNDCIEPWRRPTAPSLLRHSQSSALSL